jgi:hypothetical protein
MTPDYIFRSLDTYPVEFLDMQNNHRVLYGEDVLARLEIKPEYARLECERELKGASLHLRTGYLDCMGNRRQMRNLLQSALRSLLPVFRTLLVLSGKSVPAAGSDVVSVVEDVFKLETSALWKASENTKNDVLPVFERFVKGVDKLSLSIDNMKKEGGV